MISMKEEKEVFKTPVFSIIQATMDVKGKKTNWYCATCPEVVHAITYNPEKNIVYMINEFRLGAKEYIDNLPSGKIDSGEDSEMAAVREVEEETGLKVKKIEFLFRGRTSSGFIDEVANFFVAIVGEEPSGLLPDEDLKVIEITKEEFLSKYYQSVKTKLAQLLFKEWLEKN